MGGILLIPAIAVFFALGMHQAMATARFSFALMAILGTWLHHRKGSIDWMQAIPVVLRCLSLRLHRSQSQYVPVAGMTQIHSCRAEHFCGPECAPASSEILLQCNKLFHECAEAGLVSAGWFCGLHGRAYRYRRARHFRSLHDQRRVSAAVFRCDGPALPREWRVRREASPIC